MKILVLGAAGMIGRKLVSALITDRTHLGPDDILVLHDIIEPTRPDGHENTKLISGDLADRDITDKLASEEADIIFHLASVVSGEAEADFNKGWRMNMGGGWQLFEALKKRHEAKDGHYRPRVIFASSIAVFGPPFPQTIDDSFLTAPQTSYGAQKAMMELLLADYARKGFIDGLSIRLPTICVRPGKPNAAASSFFSGIIREPLNGQTAILPVPDTVRHWHASPRSAVGFFMHAASLDTNLLQARRALNMPGISCTVAEQIEALRDIAGEQAVSRIIPKSDETIMRIVQGWPRCFQPDEAISLGFTAESQFHDIIKIYLEDEMS
ncbi:MAG: D-erythronate dehydrogenase [Candidatus Puniceispirillaceae bacterium]